MAKGIFQGIRNWFSSAPAKAAGTPPAPDAHAHVPSASPTSGFDGVRVLKHAAAMRVIFFYPGEEGTYVDGAMVTLFENGIVHIRAKNEETTTHLQHCEILWRYEAVDETGKGGNNKLRVVKFKKGRESEAPPEEPAPN